MPSKLTAALNEYKQSQAVARATEDDLKRLAQMIAPLIIPEVIKALIETINGSQSYLENVVRETIGGLPEPLDRTDEVLRAVRGIPETDLKPILDAIGSIPRDTIEVKETDLEPILEAVKAIKMPDMPQVDQRKPKWTLIHHRDKRGRITETEAIAEWQ